MAEFVVYPFLFVTIFFQSFVLVTFLSKPAREARGRLPLHSDLPKVAIVIPCYNEEATLANTARSALALDYPKSKLSVILVNDGSTDNTRQKMDEFRDNPQVTLIHKKNGGKHTALNAGIAATDAEFVGCLDADSYVEKDALKELLPFFKNKKVGAVTAAMCVHEPKSLLEHMQQAEYLLAVAWRHALASVNGLYATPGPFSFYRRDVVVTLGGFRYGHQVEDMEMALRLQKNGYIIENAPHARVTTKVPTTPYALFKQRVRWTAGFLRNTFFDYRSLVGNPNQGVLGLLTLPIALLSQGGTVLLFVIFILSTLVTAVETLTLRADVPFSYAYTPSTSLDLFYIPTTLYALLGVVTLLIGILLMVLGKRMSGFSARLITSLPPSIVLYGLIAPLWLTRALFDVALGKTRAWR